MKNRLINKLAVEKRYKGVNMRLSGRREERDRLLVEIDRVVKGGGHVDHYTSQVASLDIEIQSLEKALSEIEGERSEIKKFENSKEAADLRKRLKALEGDHEKFYKAVRGDVDTLKASLDALFKSLVEYDDLKKALGQGDYGPLGFSSILRKKPYSYISVLRISLERWINNLKRIGID